MERASRRWRRSPFILMTLVMPLVLTLVMTGVRVLVSGPTVALSVAAAEEPKPELAILPFFIQKGEDPTRGEICPLCKGLHQSGSILPGSQNTMTRHLYEKMETLGTFTLFPLERVEEVLSRSDQKQFLEKPGFAAVLLGKELDADFVFVGYLFRFEQRIGSPMGVDKPASVSFDLHLVRVRDGKIAWTAKFDETQRPLSDNLLKIGSFFRRGAKWLTAEELASAGMGEALTGLPGVKELEEAR
jgi:hypothetical protein